MPKLKLYIFDYEGPNPVATLQEALAMIFPAGMPASATALAAEELDEPTDLEPLDEPTAVEETAPPPAAEPPAPPLTRKPPNPAPIPARPRTKEPRGESDE